MISKNRRQFLCVIAGGALVSFPGCTGEPDDSGNAEQAATDSPSTTDTEPSPVQKTTQTKASESKANGGWSMFQADSQNSGSAATEPATDGTERWNVDKAPGSVSAAIVDGTVYMGGADSNLYALDVDDGSEQWVFETDRSVLSTPAVVDGTVYFGTFDGHLFALSAEDGSERWHEDRFSSISKRSPTVAEESIYIHADNSVFALNIDDGSEQWKAGTPPIPGDQAPAVTDNKVFLGKYALNADDGTIQWEFSPEVNMSYDVSPTISGDSVIYSGQLFEDGEEAGGTVRTAAISDGSERWNFNPGGKVTVSPAVSSERVYVGSDDGKLYALKMNNGSEQWRYDMGYNWKAAPAVVQGFVYIIDANLGRLSALNASDGSVSWNFNPDAGLATMSPAVSNGIVYIGYSSKLAALN